MAKLEWRGSLYLDEGSNVVLPAESIKAALIGGAKKEKFGPQARGGTFITESPPLRHDSSRKSIDELSGDGASTNVHRVSVKVTPSRVMRTRPMFNNWSMDVDIHYDTSQAHQADILRRLETAGRIIGIGDWRPEKSGNFGRFSVERVKTHQDLAGLGLVRTGTVWSGITALGQARPGKDEGVRRLLVEHLYLAGARDSVFMKRWMGRRTFTATAFGCNLPHAKSIMRIACANGVA